MRAVNQCLDCKYWSDMIAKCEGLGPVQAMCLNKESRNHLKYTVDRVTCDKWEYAEAGFRVDSPGEGQP
jgi:hypothetical protein